MDYLFYGPGSRCLPLRPPSWHISHHARPSVRALHFPIPFPNPFSHFKKKPPKKILIESSIGTDAKGSPLAKFPGPILPAVTGWYELYADLTGGQQDTFAFRIQRMHRQYGPLVRISPWELHVSDPAFFATLYAGGAARRHKWPAAAGVMGTSLGVFGTVTHEAHQRRRAAIGPYFSRSAVLRKQALLQEKVGLLCEVFRAAMDRDLDGGDEPVLDVRAPLLALATDFYCAHALDERDQLDLLRDVDAAVRWRTSIIALLHWTPLLKQFSGITEWALELPLWLIELFSKELALVVGISKVHKINLLDKIVAMLCF